MLRLSIARTMVVGLTLALAPAAVAAQSITPAEAGAFMGVWTLTLDTPQGTFENELTVKNEDGKVVAVMTNQMQPEGQKITDVSKEGENLVLKFSGNFQGNPFDARITVSPSGDDKASVAFDINGGQFSMSGAATRKK